MAAHWRWSMAVLLMLAATHDMEASPTWCMSDFIAAVEKVELSNPGMEPATLLRTLRRSTDLDNPLLQHFLGPNKATANAPTLPQYLAQAAAHSVREDGREDGVVLTSDGTTVALGPVLLGLEAGFLSTTSRGTPRGLYQLTLARHLALAVGNPSKLPGLFPDGCWDSLSSPMEFRLSGLPQPLTTALMHGGMDGVVLGMNISSIRAGVSLSGLLRSYYSPPIEGPQGVAGAPGLIATRRRENFKQLVGQPPLFARQVVQSLELQLSLKRRRKMKRKERKKVVALVDKLMKEFVLKFMDCPPIVPRCMWQAAPYRGTPTLLSLPLPFMYIHHTSTPSAPCLTFEVCSRNMRAIQRYHQDVRGWDDIGYSFVAGSDGNLYEGRGWLWQGAHTLGHNTLGYGVAFIGDYSSRLPVNSSLELVRDRLGSCGAANASLVANYTVQGHRQVVSTSCPGDALYQEITGWEHFGRFDRYLSDTSSAIGYKGRRFSGTMEPEGPRLAPGNSCGPPGDPTNHTGSSRTAQVPGSLSLGEEPMCNNSALWLGTGEEVAGADPEREGSQRRFRSFPSSLTWDSDSEKETIDEEDLQHFANPHGMANHSPGSPSSGLRLDGENDQTPAHMQHLPAVEDGIWKVPDTPEPIKVKPKECCRIQTEEEEEKPGEAVGMNHKGKHKLEGVDAKEPSSDVYTFPGDTDAESPPPPTWAHCTFIQQQRKKALLRPFSGLVSVQHGGALCVAKSTGTLQRKQVHLQEHMSEHIQSLLTGSSWERQAKVAHLHCAECGWNLPSHPALVEHRRRHQESRARILKAIQKLENTGAEKPEEMQKVEEGNAVDPGSLDIFAVAEPNPVLGPVKGLDPEVVFNSPTLSSVPGVVDLKPALVLCADPSTPGPKPGPARTPVRTRATPAKGRRFICPTCNFSTKTSQAMANHAKTHNRTKPPTRRKSQRAQFLALELPCMSPASQSGLASSSLSFVSSGPTPSREHLNLLPEEATQYPRSILDPSVFKAGHDKEPQFTSGSLASTNPVDGRSDPGLNASRAPFCQTKELVFKCIGNRRANRRGRDWTERTQTAPELERKRCLGSVERKCPYCPERFHNGIGLANHVRGHLNRVGVSYNVRHFISAEEVNAIEKKFSYQKKRKKVANFDPDTFSVMRCEFCSAGFDTRAGLSSHARAHLRDFGILNWDVTVSPIHILREMFSSRPDLVIPTAPPRSNLGALTDASRLSPREDADDKGAGGGEDCGLTRRGLSSHARSHLRQLGVSEGTGAPINLLYRVIRERLSPPDPSAPGQRRDFEEDMDFEEKPLPLSILAKMAPSSSPSSLLTSVLMGPPGACPPRLGPSAVRKAPVSSLLPVSSPLRFPDHKTSGVKADSDAPLNLTLEGDPNKDIICQLCGAWFETRKGLSSHARAHLRHFGVEYSESKGSPITLLNQLIHTDDFKHKASVLQSHPPGHQGFSSSASKRPPLASSSFLFKGGGSPSSKATSMSSLLGPPAKRPKSSMQVFRLSSGELLTLPHNEPPKEIGCEFCGEFFENRKGLSSHARSHLRQMGITEWSVNGSPIDTLREVIAKRGLPCALPLKPRKTPPPSSPGPPRSPLSASSSSPSSSASLLGRLPFSFARPSSPQPAGCKTSPPEPEPLEVTMPGAVGASGGYPAEPLNCSWNSTDNLLPLNLVVSHEVEPTRDIQCEFCGEFFENRKGLSSHARSHLRQMGITEWSVNGSPIDTLREVMHKRGGGAAASSPSDQGLKESGRQGAASPLWENVGRPGSSEGLGLPGFHLSKFRKSPLSLLHSRPQKQGSAGSGLAGGLSPEGKGFRVSPLGKRALLEETGLGEADQSSPLLPKPLSALPPGFCFKRKSSPDKHRASPQDASCELCGFYFENRKALASHARAHLRQFGVTEWCVNGSPIETLSAWMRTRPQKVLEMHRSYMQVNRTSLKKKNISPLSPSLDHLISIPNPNAVSSPDFLSSPHHAPAKPSPGGLSPSHQSAALLPLHAQVARSELNVRLPRGFERRPLKHPSLPEGVERESSCPPKPPRTGTIPSLVPQPPSYPLVKLVGALYTLKCRFCEVEFHGPLSIQEDWIRHLQQHIIKMNYGKPGGPRDPTSTDPPSPRGPASSDPTTPRGSSSSDPNTPRDPASSDPAIPRGPASSDPAIPRGPASSDPTTPIGPASSDPTTPMDPASSDPTTPRGPASSDPTTPRGPASSDPTTPRGPASSDPTTPRGPASSDPTTSRGPASSDPTTSRGPASSDPTTPRGPASSDPTTPRGPASSDPTTPRGPASSDPTTSRGPASSDPTTPRGPASSDPTTPRGPASSDPTTPKGPTSNNAATPRGLAPTNPAILRAPASTDPPTHRSPISTDPSTQQPPASTDPAKRGSHPSTSPTIPRAPTSPSPTASPQYTPQAEATVARARAQEEEGSSSEEGPGPVTALPACVSTSCTASTVAIPSDTYLHSPPAERAPTVPGTQVPKLPEEQPTTDSAPTPDPAHSV
ncbi:hypothetical protein NHX12_031316 [Muraenolepis orangiensis]|uniref:C2H2-type domain-containing protein n=1 Tax=Muraenolepis orangiensis TaxID=630683 RepID=A0A9Q0E6U0_9TELE|nr:hypothetical protein NHX12_031316 [Muraenolepis orangiensis]